MCIKSTESFTTNWNKFWISFLFLTYACADALVCLCRDWKPVWSDSWKLPKSSQTDWKCHFVHNILQSVRRWRERRPGTDTHPMGKDTSLTSREAASSSRWRRRQNRRRRRDLTLLFWEPLSRWLQRALMAEEAEAASLNRRTLCDLRAPRTLKLSFVRIIMNGRDSVWLTGYIQWNSLSTRRKPEQTVLFYFCSVFPQDVQGNHFIGLEQELYIENSALALKSQN